MARSSVSTHRSGQATTSLPDFLTPALQGLLYQSHELIRDCTVDQPMIVAQGEVYQATNCDGVIAVFIRDHDGGLGNPAHTHDGRIWLVDDGQAEHGSELSGIGHGKSGTFDF